MQNKQKSFIQARFQTFLLESARHSDISICWKPLKILSFTGGACPGMLKAGGWDPVCRNSLIYDELDSCLRRNDGDFEIF